MGLTMETKFRNRITIDTRTLTECQKKIDKTRFYKLIKMLNQSVSADSLHPELMEEHDNYFEPRTEPERDFWVSCRELAKEDMQKLLKSSEGGKISAEIRKQKKEEKAVQKPEPELPPIKIKITEEEFLNWARQMDDMAGVGGFKNTETQAAMFWNHFNSQGWRKKNGMPITDPKSAYKLWVIKDKKDEVEEEQIQKVEIEVD